MKYLLLFVVLTMGLSALFMAWRAGALKAAWLELRPFVLWAAVAAVTVMAVMFIAYSGGHLSLLN